MTDLEKYKQRRVYTAKNANMVNNQKAILADLLERQNNYLSTCPHQFVLYLGNITLLDNEEIVYICLGCNKTIILNKDNISYNDRNIIDISTFVDQETLLYLMIYPSDLIVLKAQAILEKIAAEENSIQEYTPDFIKETIINELTKELQKTQEADNQVGKDKIKLRRAKKLIGD